VLGEIEHVLVTCIPDVVEVLLCGADLRDSSSVPIIPQRLKRNDVLAVQQNEASGAMCAAPPVQKSIELSPPRLQIPIPSNLG
jgi:hypothetical protein